MLRLSKTLHLQKFIPTIFFEVDARESLYLRNFGKRVICESLFPQNLILVLGIRESLYP